MHNGYCHYLLDIIYIFVIPSYKIIFSRTSKYIIYSSNDLGLRHTFYKSFLFISTNIRPNFFVIRRRFEYGIVGEIHKLFHLPCNWLHTAIKIYIDILAESYSNRYIYIVYMHACVRVSICASDPKIVAESFISY